MIVQADVLICSVLHAESTRHRPDLYEPEPFIQMPGVDVVFHNGIELQDRITGNRVNRMACVLLHTPKAGFTYAVAEEKTCL